LWTELVTHGVSAWELLLAAIRKGRCSYGADVVEISEQHGVATAIEEWRELDHLAYIAGRLATGT